MSGEHYKATVSVLGELGLEYPPVAMAVVNSQPAGISEKSQAVSACAFWREAEAEVFYASSEDHCGCSVGAHVMGVDLPEPTKLELVGSIKLMAEVGYLRESEIPNIPQLVKSGSGVVYGPLSKFPLEADCALVWANPSQAMLLGEALLTTSWKSEQSEVATLFGRPACGAVARAINTQSDSFSLGCAGMRTFTEVSPNVALFVIPGCNLVEMAEALGAIINSNKDMLKHYQEKRNAVA